MDTGSIDGHRVNRWTAGAVSLKLLGGKLAPELVCFMLNKELVNFGESMPRYDKTQVNWSQPGSSIWHILSSHSRKRS